MMTDTTEAVERPERIRCCVLGLQEWVGPVLHDPVTCWLRLGQDVSCLGVRELPDLHKPWSGGCVCVGGVPACLPWHVGPCTNSTLAPQSFAQTKILREVKVITQAQ